MSIKLHFSTIKDKCLNILYFQYNLLEYVKEKKY